MARKSRLINKLAFILITTILFVTVYYLNNLYVQNVRGNWGPVVVIYIATVILVLIQKEEPEDHYKIRAGKYSTPSTIKTWYEFQKERRKTHEPTVTLPRLAFEPRLSVPFLFLILPCIFSIILLVLMPEVEPSLTFPFIFSLILLALGLRSLYNTMINRTWKTLREYQFKR